jgi:alpha-galactosidase
MDDGWFGERNDDKRSLGDWYVNEKKLPGGLGRLCDKINALGLDFGIWVEPEMVNVDSNLYREHPEWVIEVPGKPHSEGRNQRILDLTNPDVVDYLIEVMSGIFSSANITYVKWDMNRIFSDYYSQRLDADRQGEVAHRYILGLYRLMGTLTERFPKILFEGCASGGNRFDLGILSYFPQIWASDDTDAIYRVKGQTGYSYGYPMSTVTAHVSACPNHQTLRVTPLSTRFDVAAFGVLGYECNLCDMGSEELKTVKAQIALYKEWRDVLQYGTFYRGRSGNLYEWTCVSEDKKRAVGMVLQVLAEPNTAFTQYFPRGLVPEERYHFYNFERKVSVKPFGDLVNMISPVHIKQNSILHNIVDRFVKMPGEIEDYVAFGDVLMSGVKLKGAFAGTGYDENTRFFPDFASRMYFIESEDN